ncbi:hypothetical protein [Mesoflavibacter sp. SCSIO 43206]|uniref:hypothetical protein n=1 Tax=Mesoflavibacter sp. SCSIO 43206 TaxID=2779362 RepID=UPI001CA7FC5D|nr:hypothetical protein [Mesoflavibacter sp. SCSIO 43206]UAB74314.1 hypothetical protein INR78_07865 [Mesoflavibacter sp. SCSIO 43206]
MKKTLLLTLTCLLYGLLTAQTITYSDMIIGSENYEVFRETLLSKNYMIESHNTDKDGYVTDIFYPIELANKGKKHRVSMSYKPNMKPAYILLNICDEYKEKFIVMQNKIKANFSVDKTYFNEDANNYTTRYSNGKTYFTIANYLDSNNSSLCVQITCSKKF